MPISLVLSLDKALSEEKKGISLNRSLRTGTMSACKASLGRLISRLTNFCLKKRTMEYDRSYSSPSNCGSSSVNSFLRKRMYLVRNQKKKNRGSNSPPGDVKKRKQLFWVNRLLRACREIKLSKRFGSGESHFNSTELGSMF